MDNKQIARILRETAQLLEIDGAIIGRYRSYEKAAELIDGLPESIEQLVKEPEKLKELPGIGDRMVEHLQEIVKTGDYALRRKLLKKYPASILDLLQLQSLGPKKVAFLWSNFKAGTVADVERIAKEGKLRDLPDSAKKANKIFSKPWKSSRNPVDDFIFIRPKTRWPELFHISRKKEKPSNPSRQRAHCAGAKRPWAILIYWSPLRMATRRKSTWTRLPSTSLHFPASIKHWLTEKTRSASR